MLLVRACSITHYSLLITGATERSDPMPKRLLVARERAADLYFLVHLDETHRLPAGRTRIGSWSAPGPRRRPPVAPSPSTAPTSCASCAPSPTTPSPAAPRTRGAPSPVCR